MPRKLGVNSTQRLALLKNQASYLLWYGKIETTLARAKEVRRYAEKIITLAVNTYENTIEEKVEVTDAKGKVSVKTVVKDGSKKLSARSDVEILNTPQRDDGADWFFFRDPDGNLIELMDLGKNYFPIKYLSRPVGFFMRKFKFKKFYTGKS